MEEKAEVKAVLVNWIISRNSMDVLGTILGRWIMMVKIGLKSLHRARQIRVLTWGA